ncbi:MAG: hypothetical protein K0R27_3944 [Xanthobacteraceae bacterium]|jgi:ferritin-like metal-binding protein YciE|nr:hypothetical protein [Xanthobacteraceae bacterium]
MSSADENSHSIFVVGLRNAHAMEKEAIALMERQISSIETYPEMKAKLESHLLETRGQHERLDRILESLGEDRSAFKDMAMNLSGNLSALTASMADDAILKTTFANYAFENFEAAAYRSLIKMAELDNQPAAIPLLEQSLNEERAMARWIDEHVVDVTARYVKISQAGNDASL